nr:retrovirus-related Pol polyprotein from transposon TNT 1-94 [Tanacetum cinerariifolium]
MRPFGCPVTILNTLDPLGKFQEKVDEGFLVGYFVCSKAFRVFNSRTRIIQETLHVNFMENKSNVAGSGPAWLFDIDSLSLTMNYHPSVSPSCGDQAKEQGDKAVNKNKVFAAGIEFTNSTNDFTTAGPLVSATELNFTNSTNDEFADDVAQPTSPLPPSPVIPSSPPHQDHLHHKLVKGLETANTAQQLEILKLKAQVKKLERLNKVKSSKLRRLKKVGTSQRIEPVVDQEKDDEIEERQADTQAEIYNIDLDHSSKVLSMQEDDADVQEAVEIVTTAKLMTEVVTAATTQVVAASTPIPATKPTVVTVSTPISAAKPAAKLKVLKIVPAAPAVSTRKRKGVIIREPEEELHDDTPAETLSVKDKDKGILVEDPKPMKKKDQIELDVEYSREEMQKEEEDIIKSINETPAQKAAKRRRLHEQAKDLKKQLEVVVDKDDDVFIEATPISRKVPVVNYEIVMINNKPRLELMLFKDAAAAAHINQLMNQLAAQRVQLNLSSQLQIASDVTLMGAYKVDGTQSSVVVRDKDARIQKKSNGLVTLEKEPVKTAGPKKTPKSRTCIPDVGNNGLKTVKDGIGGFFAWTKNQVVLDEEVTPPTMIQKISDYNSNPKLQSKSKNYVSHETMQRQARTRKSHKSLNYGS